MLHCVLGDVIQRVLTSSTLKVTAHKHGMVNWSKNAKRFNTKSYETNNLLLDCERHNSFKFQMNCSKMDINLVLTSVCEIWRRLYLFICICLFQNRSEGVTFVNNRIKHPSCVSDACHAHNLCLTGRRQPVTEWSFHKSPPEPWRSPDPWKLPHVVTPSCRADALHSLDNLSASSSCLTPECPLGLPCTSIDVSYNPKEQPAWVTCSMIRTLPATVDWLHWTAIDLESSLPTRI